MHVDTNELLQTNGSLNVSAFLFVIFAVGLIVSWARQEKCLEPRVCVYRA